MKLYNFTGFLFLLIQGKLPWLSRVDFFCKSDFQLREKISKQLLF